MPVIDRLKNFLEQKAVDYKHTVHPLAYTAREVASAEHLPAREVAKSVVVRAGDSYYMVVLPANRWADLAELRAALGVPNAHLATETELAELFPDCELGAMPPFGNLYGMPVYVDQALADDEEIAFNAGTHRDTVHMRLEDFRRVVDPVIAPLGREVSRHGW